MFIIESLDKKGRWRKSVPIEFRDQEDAVRLAKYHYDKTGQPTRVVEHETVR